MQLLMLACFCVFNQAHGVVKVEVFDESLKQQFLQAHNDLRGKVDNPKAANMQMLSWDDELAAVAEKNVRKCKRGHSPAADRKTSEFPIVGENLYRIGAKPEMLGLAERVVRMWYAEIEYYNFENGTCVTGKMCGHYTQVIWATTVKVGCAVAWCEGDVIYQGLEVCCNYGPIGNHYKSDGTALSPYSVGPPCSQCGQGQRCKNQLCYTPDATGVSKSLTTSTEATTITSTTLSSTYSSSVKSIDRNPMVTDDGSIQGDDRTETSKSSTTEPTTLTSSVADSPHASSEKPIDMRPEQTNDTSILDGTVTEKTGPALTTTTSSGRSLRNVNIALVALALVVSAFTGFIISHD